jgi:hypothetical protein
MVLLSVFLMSTIFDSLGMLLPGCLITRVYCSLSHRLVGMLIYYPGYCILLWLLVRDRMGGLGTLYIEL